MQAVPTMAFTIDYKAAGAELRFTDLVSGQEILEAKQEFFAHRFPEKARYVICDFTDAQKFEIPSTDLDRIVDQDRKAMSAHPVLLEAIIAPKPLVYGLSRMWQAKVDAVRPHTAVVRTRDEAVAWLKAAGITPSGLSSGAGQLLDDVPLKADETV